MSACWPLRMPPTAKAVLISLADNANDNGHCWPSIPKISERTCFGKTAVIEAIKWLEDNGALRADRSNGRGTTYILSPENYQQPVRETDCHQSGKRTGPANEPVREPEPTSPAGGLHPSGKRTAPVRQADPNRKEPSIEPSGNRQKKTSLGADDLVALGVSPQHAADWLTIRKGKKLPLTPTALEGIQREAELAQVSLADAVRISAENNWAGFKAKWLENQSATTSTSTLMDHNRAAAAEALRRSREREARHATG